jgi:hypothetical protein
MATERNFEVMPENYDVVEIIHKNMSLLACKATPVSMYHIMETHRGVEVKL